MSTKMISAEERFLAQVTHVISLPQVDFLKGKFDVKEDIRAQAIELT